jgi:UDP-N-acetylglucosamine acyltransferase
MTSKHVAHNCVLDDEVIMANLATLGGHCHVGKGAFLGGMSVFHQNVRIGEMCIISGFSAARMDCLPYVKGEGRPPIPHGINAIGLKRRGVSAESRNNIKQALKILQSGEYLITKACDIIEQEIPNDEYVTKFIQFIRESKRGITLRKSENTL